MVPAELLRLHPLLLGRGDVERQHRQHGAVHRHRHRHLVERDAVEERARVVDRVDRHAGHADVAAHPRVVGVVAAVGGQVEGDAQALLAGRQVAPVERVGLLGGGEAGVLPDRPRLGGVHRRVGPAQERAEARARCRARRAPRGARGRRPAGCRCPPGSCQRLGRDRVQSADHAGLRPTSGSPAKLFGTLMPASPSSGVRNVQRVDAHRAGVVDVESRSACRRGSPTGHRPRAAPLTASAPHSSYAASRAGQADDRLPVVRRDQVVGGRRSGRPTSTATPPAASRLAANVARAVCAATVPMVARKTGAAAGSSRSASKAAP